MLEEHPDRNALERFSRGAATIAEERWIEDHLRAGCAVCQEEVDDLLRPALEAALLPGIEIPAEMLDDEGMWRRISADFGRRVDEVARERKAAPALVAELTARPAPELARLARRRRFQTFAVCELLLEKSFEEGFRHPAAAIELAGLGLELAGRLDSGHYGASVVQDLRARAWAYLGNARRIAFDLAGAEEALARAKRLAESGSGDPLEEARILDFRASLLSDQGRFEAAAELLDVVIDIYTELREAHRRGRALISKGVIIGHAGWPEEALRLLREGLSFLDWEREPRLVLMARHNLAWFLNECKRSAEACRYLERFRHTYREIAAPWATIRLLWLSGRIAGGLGRFEEAGDALREARQRFLEEGQGYDASLVTLDLAHLYLQQGRTAEVKRLAGEMLPVFLSQDVHREATAALAVFQEAAEAGGVTPHLVRKISAYLLRARNNPRLRFELAAA
ncbi:hypothetical protein EHM82_02400 [bacterium]|nr:MAG: hypothetical protein EHM82_02400 [bacterium]